MLQEAFRRRGFGNVRVTSFGVSTSPAKHLSGAAERTLRYAVENGYGGIRSHRRRHIGDGDVEREIKKADLLLAISPGHAALAAEYGADENPRAAHDVLRKTWTLEGLARRTEWTAPLIGVSLAFNRLYRGIALKDPYFQPKTPEGNREFDRRLGAVVAASKKAAERLMPKEGKPRD